MATPTITLVASEAFVAWLDGLNSQDRKKVIQRVGYLRAKPLTLGQPYVTHIPQSRHGIRELRVDGRDPIRVFFGYTSDQRLVLAIGASKKGVHEGRAQSRWAVAMAAEADDIIDAVIAGGETEPAP